MMRSDGVNDFRRLAVLACQLRTDNRVRSLDFMIHRFTNIVKEGSCLCNLDVATKLLCEHSRDVRHLN